ncbi:unnamed protein product [Prunus armeniaca]
MNFRGKKSSAICDYCRQRRHIRETCWILHPHLKPRNEKNAKSAHGSAAKNVSSTNDYGNGVFSKNAPGSNLSQVTSKETYANHASLNSPTLFGELTKLLQQKTIGEGVYSNGLYLLHQPLDNSRAFQVNSPQNSLLWHQCLGHPSNQVLSCLFPSFVMDSNVCEVCQFSKQTRKPFASSLSKVDKPFELIHSDLWGAPIESHDGYKYFVTFVDDLSRAIWLYLLKSKKEVVSCFKDFHKLIVNQFNSQIKVLRSDNGTEFMTSSMSEFLTGEGIIHETSCVGTPQQNGVAERKNRDLLEKTRSLMFQMNVPKKLWSQVVLTAAYLINRLPSRILGSKSPLEILKNRKIDLSHLRVFGCLCFVHVQATQRDKFDPRATRSAFLGYSSTQKGYKCYDPKARKMVISRDVQFVETEAFFKEKLGADSQRKNPFDQVPLLIVDTTEGCYPSNTDGDGADSRNSLSHNLAGDNDISPQNEESVFNGEHSHAIIDSIISSNGTLQRLCRIKNKPTKFQDFVTYHTYRYPIQKYISYDKVSRSHSAFLSKISKISEPTCFQEAKSKFVWRKAMEEEIQALDENNTWTIVKLPEGKKPVGCKWVYKIKFRSDGSIERHKARLVAKGFTQTYGVDYKETFAPVAKMNTIRVLLSIAVNYDWPLYQMDVKNAFLHGDLKEEVYMNIPPGHPQENQEGFDGSFGKLVVLIYVDDLIITGSNNAEISKLKFFLSKNFAIKELGALKYFLGIEIALSKKGMFLNQRKYVLDLLQETGMLGAKPTENPVNSKEKLSLDGELL